jgi:hypothetical protein
VYAFKKLCGKKQREIDCRESGAAAAVGTEFFVNCCSGVNSSFSRTIAKFHFLTLKHHSDDTFHKTDFFKDAGFLSNTGPFDKDKKVFLNAYTNTYVTSH